MSTQRVNTYVSGSNLRCYYIEECNEKLHEWFTVGDVYENLALAISIVENHNLRQLANKIFKQGK